MSHRVDPSSQNDVDRDVILRRLAERAVLTRAMCRELLDSKGQFTSRRVATALGILLRWIHETLPESVRIEARPGDGLDQMIVPHDYRELLEEIRDGALVGQKLFWLLTADSLLDFKTDESILRESLETYWAKHPSPASAPPAFSS